MARGASDGRLTANLLGVQADVVWAHDQCEQALDRRRRAVAACRDAGWSLQRIATALGVSKTAAAGISTRQPLV